jgi:regulatory protein
MGPGLMGSSFSGRSSRPSSRGSSLRPRSDCGCPSEGISELSDTIISKLKSKKYLDDFRFAEYYVENRFVKKGVSTKRLKVELMKKGISKEIIEEVLSGSERNDTEEIVKIIKKKQSRYTEEKMINYLLRQGFSYELSREQVAQFYGKD